MTSEIHKAFLSLPKHRNTNNLPGIPETSHRPDCRQTHTDAIMRWNQVTERPLKISDLKKGERGKGRRGEGREREGERKDEDAKGIRLLPPYLYISSYARAWPALHMGNKNMGSRKWMCVWPIMSVNNILKREQTFSGQVTLSGHVNYIYVNSFFLILD